MDAEVSNAAKLLEVSAAEPRSDELEARTDGRLTPQWTHSAVEIWSQVWLTSPMGRWTLRNTLFHSREARWRWGRSRSCVDRAVKNGHGVGGVGWPEAERFSS
ncbi:hypothetical protein Pla86_12820 [Planctomycetes bacterium Pla86]|uniref:Uncharacterized protein n=1 Tax=Engelhardtia mirabilis TaxID=2528011 RepID=A0A518BGY0_9BACT|nr:hypothetical protein Pla133_12820 [Planctomycetes bacterium Pla133]QDV00543.1 hypothetical protein Pla86_12820 [Planctomycetes bacterium Pla86]